MEKSESNPTWVMVLAWICGVSTSGRPPVNLQRLYFIFSHTHTHTHTRLESLRVLGVYYDR